MLEKAYAVIMAGGKGERFWPLSNSQTPKQVLPLVSEKPMLAMTVDYIRALIPPERVLIITSAALVEVTRRALPELPPENVVGEPFGRDTAAAVALGSALVKARCPDGVFCVLTADHVIGDLDIFHATIREGLDYALTHDVLMTIGIPPAFPSTGFGYIDSGDVIETDGTVPLRSARGFVEKPDAATAQGYVTAGNFFWNSGMFIWSVAALQSALGKFQPHLLAMADRLEPVVWSDARDQHLAEEYGQLDKISVDYAIMEKADNIVMARGGFAWSDIGSWPALCEHFQPDGSGNTILGLCETVASHDNVVVSRDRLTALIGVSDLVVVQAEGATLICPKDRAQDVKAMVNQLHERGIYEDLL